MAEKLNLAVGQVWQTRGGAMVHITRDRCELEDGDALRTRWRWALSNSCIVDDCGRCGTHEGEEHPSDLIKLLEDGS